MINPGYRGITITWYEILQFQLDSKLNTLSLFIRPLCDVTVTEK